MANNEINDLTAKTTPVSTDEVEIQETAGGLSKKATVGNLAKGMSYNDLNDKPTIPIVSDTAYDATSWNGNTDAPTKNAVRDKIESMGGGGDVVGPASSTDNAIARFDGTTGKLLQNSGVSIDDSNNVTIPSAATLTVDKIDIGREERLELYDSTNIITSQLSGTQTATTNSYYDIVSSGSRVRFTGDDVQANTISERTAAAGVTIDGVLVKDGAVDGVDVSTTYRTGGTDVALADGGTGASLTDPNADRIMFWDDSAGAVTWLTPSTGLTVSGTNMTVRTSSATQTGIVELATTAETTTATDTARAVTPAGIGAERSATATLTNKTLSTGSTIDANVTVTEVLKKVYPVGSIYTATVATNPATLFGFGTWAAYGEGRVIVGKAAAGTFGTAGATGGAETHTLTTTEMPVHTHTQNAHNHQYFRQRALSAESVSPDSGTAYASTGAVSDRKTEPYTYNATATNQNAGGGGAHNNLQPYIVAYLWERTA